MARCWSSSARARGALLEHDLAVVEHALAQQVEHRAHHVQHDDVVARLDDGHVELGVQPASSAGLRLRWAASILAKTLSITARSVSEPSARRAFGGQPLHVAAEGDVVEHRLVVIGEQRDQRRREGRAQNVGHEDAGAGRGRSAARASSSSATASRRLGRDTPSCSDSSRSDGSRSPGRRMPRRISSSIWRTTAVDSFSGVILLERHRRTPELVKSYDRFAAAVNLPQPVWPVGVVMMRSPPDGSAPGLPA